MEEKMNNGNSEYTVCFRIPDTRKYYIGFTVHSFCHFFCNCIDNIVACSIQNILSSQFSNRPIFSFPLFNLLAVVHERDLDQDIPDVCKIENNFANESN